MLLIDRKILSSLNQRVLVKYKRSAFSFALILSLCGVLCLIFPVYAGVVLSYLTGFLLTLCGFYSLTCAFTFRKNGKIAIFSLIIFSIIYIIMGASVLLTPMLGINILSMIICFLFLLAGFSRISAAFRNPSMVGRYWCMFIGILDLIIALIWIGANEDTTYYLVSIFIGLEMTSSAYIYFTLSNYFEGIMKKNI